MNFLQNADGAPPLRMKPVRSILPVGLLAAIPATNPQPSATLRRSATGQSTPLPAVFFLPLVPRGDAGLNKIENVFEALGLSERRPLAI
jgi:hypothetical protein